MKLLMVDLRKWRLILACGLAAALEKECDKKMDEIAASMEKRIKGAQASAIVYSIVETAKANNLKPYEYLQHLLSVMMEHLYDADTAYLEDLMPWSENLPDTCKKAP